MITPINPTPNYVTHADLDRLAKIQKDNHKALADRLWTVVQEQAVMISNLEEELDQLSSSISSVHLELKDDINQIADQISKEVERTTLQLTTAKVKDIMRKEAKAKD